MRSTLHRSVAAGIATTAVAAFATVAPGSPAGAQDVEFTTPGAFDWVVPQTVCAVTITARGGSGGLSQNPVDQPGVGAIASATFEVTPGETLVITVGGKGGDGVPGEPVPGGFGGGGAGHSTRSGAGAGGGGASDVRQGGSGLDDRVLVAGGGAGNGGGDALAGGGAGGDGGHPEGSDGNQGGIGGDPPVLNSPGGGGTQTEGGAGGQFDGGAPAGSSGTFGHGGDAATTGHGGGGGGGYFGGGGGTTGDSFPGNGTPAWFLGASGGGGGSSFVAPHGTDVSFETPEEPLGDGAVELDVIDCPPGPPTTTTTTTATPGDATVGEDTLVDAAMVVTAAEPAHAVGAAPRFAG